MIGCLAAPTDVGHAVLAGIGMPFVAPLFAVVGLSAKSRAAASQTMVNFAPGGIAKMLPDDGVMLFVVAAAVLTRAPRYLFSPASAETASTTPTATMRKFLMRVDIPPVKLPW